MQGEKEYKKQDEKDLEGHRDGKRWCGEIIGSEEIYKRGKENKNNRPKT